MIPNSDLPSKKDATETNKYKKMLKCCGYNPEAEGLAEILSEMHDQALSQGLTARAFKKWQLQQKITAEGKEEINA